MDFGKQYTQKLALVVTACIAVSVLICLLLWGLCQKIFPSDQILQITSWAVLSGAVVTISTQIIVRTSFKPLGTLADAIIFAGHNSRGGTPPDTKNLLIGREMITSLALQVYDLTTMSTQSVAVADPEKAPTQSAELLPQTSVIEHIGMPLIGINPDQIITIVNKEACQYLNITSEAVVGKAFYDVVKLYFQTDDTFELWLKDKQASVINASKAWERVRTCDLNGKTEKQFDLVVGFKKESQSGTETMLALYDKTVEYSKDDQEIGFVALAVHELRTPLTIMRGYIEVFEDEVGPTLTPELAGFMHKMQASAQQLTAFVGNILNVARVEENQLTLKLQQYDWTEVLKVAVNDLALRAGVHGKHLEVRIADNIPPVAVDRISIHEVINNLVDNAIKYSERSDKIIISTIVNQDGMVETSIQDFGIGISASAMPDLFQKYYRSHKSSVQVSGTGLGLYLSKAIITAHDGNIWVRSKEGEGSIFSFTIQPFDHLKHEQTTGQDGIMRGAHGWIKNHSLNRQ